MEKEFIPYEQASQLKKLGFNEPCITSYNESGKLFKIWEDEQVIGITKCLAPTFSQAFRWFREKYGLYAIIIPTVTVNWTFKTMTVAKNMAKIHPYTHVDAYDYNTHEEAELGCLKKLIDIVTK